MCIDFCIRFIRRYSAGITSSAVRLKICAITAGIKNYKSIIKKRRKKRDKIVLLRKATLNTIEAVISKALSNSYVIHDDFFSLRNK